MAEIVFIPAGDISNAGSRMRCYWPAQFLPNSAVVTWDDIRAGRLPEAGVYVFQKLVDVALMRTLRERGALVFWDVCDPVWWFNPADAREAAAAATAGVASSDELAEDFNSWAGEIWGGGRGCYAISDRLLIDHYNVQREHGEARPVRLIWFGSAQNRIALYGVGATLARLRANGYEVALTICDNAPESPLPGLDTDIPVYYTRWSLAHEAETLAAHDIALLPPYPGAWGRVKSNNRTLTAWAAGLPVTTGLDYGELRELVCDPDLRRKRGAQGRRTVEQYWRVEQSANEWRLLIDMWRAIERNNAFKEAVYA